MDVARIINNRDVVSLIPTDASHLNSLTWTDGRLHTKDVGDTVTWIAEQTRNANTWRLLTTGSDRQHQIVADAKLNTAGVIQTVIAGVISGRWDNATVFVVLQARDGTGDQKKKRNRPVAGF